MKKKRLFVTVVCFIFAFTLAGCMADMEEEERERTKSEESMEEGSMEDKVTDTEESEVAVEKMDPKEELPEEKKINYTHFEDLSLAAEQVGFSFRAIEGTEDAYFSSFSITEGQAEDEEGNKVGDPYPMVVLQYKRKTNKLPAFTVMIYPVQGEIEPPPTYVLTEEIEGIPVTLTDYILIMHRTTYELTDEDWEFVNSGKGSFSSDGETEGEIHCRDMYWQEDGIFYQFDNQIPDLSVEAIRDIVRAILIAEFR